MIAIELTAEYDPQTHTLTVLLPEGLDPLTLTIKRRRPEAQAQTTPDKLPSEMESERDEATPQNREENQDD